MQISRKNTLSTFYSHHLRNTIHASLWPHPTVLILNIPILYSSQRLKQFQKARSNPSIPKFNLDIAVRDTLNRLGISFDRKNHTVITAAVPQAATSENLAT